MDLKSVLVDVISDIEQNTRAFHCYAYPKTIRSILTAAEKSPIAPKFKEKYYHGICSYISLTKIENTLELLCEEKILTFSIYNDKRRYLLLDKSYINKSEENFGLTDEENKEIDNLLEEILYL